MTNTNCPNCGAPIDIHAEKCAYCDTPYVYISKQRSDQVIGRRISDLEEKACEFKLEVMRDDLYKEAIKAMDVYSRHFTMNENRRLFGLREI